MYASPSKTDRCIGICCTGLDPALNTTTCNIRDCIFLVLWYSSGISTEGDYCITSEHGEYVKGGVGGRVTSYQCWFMYSLWVTVKVHSLLLRDSSSWKYTTQTDLGIWWYVDVTYTAVIKTTFNYLNMVSIYVCSQCIAYFRIGEVYLVLVLWIRISMMFICDAKEMWCCIFQIWITYLYIYIFGSNGRHSMTLWSSPANYWLEP